MIVNVSGYRFVDLPDRDELREPMLEHCLGLGLKGTVLLSPNGINFFLAGTQEATDHNLYIRGNIMYQSNYRSGLRVLDVSDPENPVEIGYFDTVPYGDNSAGMRGSWSNYPYFKSGVVIVTSSNEGLFLLKKRQPIT